MSSNVQFVRKWHRDARDGDATEKLEFVADVVAQFYNPRKILDVIPGRLSQAELHWALQDALKELKRLRELVGE